MRRIDFVIGQFAAINLDKQGRSKMHNYAIPFSIDSWGGRVPRTDIHHPVILSEAKNLCVRREILRFAQNDKTKRRMTAMLKLVPALPCYKGYPCFSTTMAATSRCTATPLSR